MEDPAAGLREMRRVSACIWDSSGPFTSGVGPAGSPCAALEPAGQDALREECRRHLGDPRGPFHLSARSWAIRGTRS